MLRSDHLRNGCESAAGFQWNPPDQQSGRYHQLCNGRVCVGLAVKSSSVTWLVCQIVDRADSIGSRQHIGWGNPIFRFCVIEAFICFLLASGGVFLAKCAINSKYHNNRLAVGHIQIQQSQNCNNALTYNCISNAANSCSGLPDSHIPVLPDSIGVSCCGSREIFGF